MFKNNKSLLRNEKGMVLVVGLVNHNGFNAADYDSRDDNNN